MKRPAEIYGPYAYRDIIGCPICPRIGAKTKPETRNRGENLEPPYAPPTPLSSPSSYILEVLLQVRKHGHMLLLGENLVVELHVVLRQEIRVHHGGNIEQRITHPENELRRRHRDGAGKGEGEGEGGRRESPSERVESSKCYALGRKMYIYMYVCVCEL